MVIAVLSDIHGNYTALKRCIDYSIERGAQIFLFLGDYIGELAYPERTMNMLNDLNSKYNCVFIRGNKENYWVAYQADGNENGGWADNNSTTGMLLYAYQHLTADDIAFFKGLPIKCSVEVPGYPPFLICHGSPDKVNEKLAPGHTRLHEIMDEMKTSLLICGHTHRQGRETYHDKLFLNPGSVGLPLLSGGRTQFLLLHGKKDGWVEELICLEYDVNKVVADMRAEELEIHAPYWSFTTERLLKTGEISHGAVLGKTMALCKADLGYCSWPHIPEKYWEKAIEELFR